MLDAIFREDNRIAGQYATILIDPLLDSESAMTIESTNGFGENTDGAPDALLLVGGEVITATGRTTTTFTGLTRGVDASTILPVHPPGTIVYDLSQNTSARDHLRRGFLVNTAIGEDLDVIGSNLGLLRCPGLTEEEWREVIRAVAYLPKQTLDAFRQALESFLGIGNFVVTEDLIGSPYQVFVEIVVALSTLLKGRFVINSGEPQLTTGVSEVTADYDVIEPTLSGFPGAADLEILGRTTVGGSALEFPPTAAGTAVVGVFDDTPLTRRGFRAGLTNYFLPGGSVAGAVVTLGTSPGAPGTAVLVDYTAFSAHYLAPNEVETDDGGASGDFYAYLSDPLLTARCVLDLIRAAGVKVNLSVSI
jgi:hypothetical protein